MKLVEVIAEILRIEPETLHDRSDAASTPGWDSLRHIEIMLAIETAYDVRLSIAEMTALRHLGDIETVLRSKGVEPGEVPSLAMAA